MRGGLGGAAEASLRRSRCDCLVSCCVCGLWAGVASARSAANGTLEICKAADNGAAGAPFNFTATRARRPRRSTSIGGTCSTPVTAAAGNWVILEDLSSGIWNQVGASVQPANALLAENDKVGKVKVAVTAGAETQVTVTNAQAAATIKVCKYSSSPAIQGAQFSFTIGTTAVTATAGSSKATAGCSDRRDDPAGLEAQDHRGRACERDGRRRPRRARTRRSPARSTAWSRSPPVRARTSSGSTTSPSGRRRPATSRSARTPATSSSPRPIRSRSRSPTAPASPTPRTILAGQCSGPIKVAAGNVNVAETPGGNTFVSSIWTIPSNALGPNNPTNGTATVVVPVSSRHLGEVQLHVENSTLDGDAEGLQVPDRFERRRSPGRRSVRRRRRRPAPARLAIVASTSAERRLQERHRRRQRQRTCGPGRQHGHRRPRPPMPFVGADGNAPGAGETKVITIGPRHQHDQLHQPGLRPARDLQEHRRRVTTGDRELHTATRVQLLGQRQQDAPVPVAAGRCASRWSCRPATTRSRRSTIPYGFQFVSSTATGPDRRQPVRPAGRELRQPDHRYRAVVQRRANGGETLVTFTNKVQRVSIKICKLIDPGSATAIGAGATRSTSRRSTASQRDAASTSPPYPGANSCTGLLFNIPVINPNGSGTTITVTEQINGPYHPTGIDLTFGNGGTGSVTFGGGPGRNSLALSGIPAGVMVETWTNAYGAPAANG